MYQLDLKARQYQPERMDQLALDADQHRLALHGLRRLNSVSGVAGQFWKYASAWLTSIRGRPARVLDVASGGGDVPLALWKLARRHQVQLQILGIDQSETACQYARQRCRRAGEWIEFRQQDVIRDALPGGFDLVTCSLFLHHLPSRQVSAMLERMSAAGRMLLVSDLRRSRSGYLLAQAACRLLSRSPIVRDDGPQSVANAFATHEVRQLCEAAGLRGAQVYQVWPCRQMIVWKQS
jgi:2-polyprenyl-3-methyl-5-hydroxy-6-metoxy-1,4-benzoquinol methylase